MTDELKNQLAINLVNIKKNYGDVQALKGISFDVKRGEMFGLVGPDGAGKTTTIRLLCGLLTPSGGSAEIFGMDLVKQRSQIQKNIGYLSQKFSLYGDLTIDENIEFFASIHGVKNYKERRNELLEYTRLTEFRKRLADNLSGGMKQKLALACTLIHKPKIIFLDEPTTGVDPVSRRDFWKILSNLIKDGITIFMSTPYLDEAERCNRVALLNNGEVISFATPKSIKESLDKQIIEIVCSPILLAYKVIKEKSNFETQMFGDRINVAVNNYEKDFTVIEKILVEAGVQLADHRVIPTSLENVFIHLISENKQ
ncbi:MAG TPA: ABC transporter ATP-binding protein [Ignavibacteriaceae bacterium]|nr:ABC transporter ATP-binding protein [Ignavibacteriaceae bacterium]